MSSHWDTIRSIYFIGMAVTALIIFFFSRDSIKMRLLAALLIGTTWPLSFPVALIFLFF
ncbi:uncharacterized protein DUF2566 [Enterobacillus tribolii]|uniref:Uncharacterized protein DUF2566 n=1 Tax=Enterobacillus tribolii TaxID=1487935 RepID=A0A370Q6W4_9GAMM|nr:GhoT/OrtT family toxin [Enterobacillus tribolii]RDK84093.1 uncharacterized protein DUF2566 [Enterobacillus tribolii]